MIPWRELGRTRVGDKDLILARRGEEFALRLGGAELMNSRQHSSEDALARLGCAAFGRVAAPRVMIGGLGMGFTARAALDVLPTTARVTIVELLPQVVAWNREHLAELAKNPLDDPRVTVVERDVVDVIAESSDRWNAILLDVDNGPDAFTSPSNRALYGIKGLMAAKRALAKSGVLGVWSVENDNAFTDRMKGVGFEVDKQRVPARPNSSVKHVIWLGHRR
jgi:spermidine synthase